MAFPQPLLAGLRRYWPLIGMVVLILAQAAVPDNLEARTSVAKFFLDGSIMLLWASGLLLYVFLRGYALLLRGKIIEGLSTGIPAGGALYVVGFLAFLVLTDLDDHNQDCIIYAAADAPSRKLIAQFYETGPIYHPHWRTILVEDADASFRPYTEVSFDYPADSSSDLGRLSSAFRSEDYAHLPRHVTLPEGRFTLEEVRDFDGRVIKEQRR